MTINPIIAIGVSRIKVFYYLNLYVIIALLIPVNPRALFLFYGVEFPGDIFFYTYTHTRFRPVLDAIKVGVR